METTTIVELMLALWPRIVTGVHLLFAVATSIHVVLYKRDVRAAIGWVGLIWLAPIAGSLLYLVFGVNRIRRRATRLKGPSDEAELPMPTPSAELPRQRADEVAVFPSGIPAHVATLTEFVAKTTRMPLTLGNRVEPLMNGDEAYPAMLGAIDRAERSVALCTYIFDEDRAGGMFFDALANAVRRGVEVRVLIDGAGAKYSRTPIARTLRAHSVRVATFLEPFVPWPSRYMNLRNHRKLLIADGRIAFTGGMNIREGHLLRLSPSDPGQDLHFLFEGPVVSQFLDVFMEDWKFTTREQLESDAWHPEVRPAGPVAARCIPDGPDEDFEAIRWTILGALSNARSSVRIVTPYFLPDQTLITALNVAAMRGVEVDIVLPEVVNLRFVQWASIAQLWQVLERGCRVWLSTPPFDHTKLMLVDDAWALVGTANWDARSLRLNFELDVECYGPELARRLSCVIDAKQQGGRALTLEDVQGRSLPVKLRDGVVRLAAPYL